MNEKRLELWFPVWPVRVNQYFGSNGEWYRANGINIAGHNGWDFHATHGQPVRAAHDGIVTEAGRDNKEGYGVVIRTLGPFAYKGGEAYFKTIYWHLIATIPVRVGQRVNAGDVIGYADNTGFSTGDHLHFGLKPERQGEKDAWFNVEQTNGYLGAIDPAPYWNGKPAEFVTATRAVLAAGFRLVEQIKAFLRTKVAISISKDERI